MTSPSQCLEEKSIPFTDIKLRCQDIIGHKGSHTFTVIGVTEIIKRLSN